MAKSNLDESKPGLALGRVLENNLGSYWSKLLREFTCQNISTSPSDDSGLRW